MFQDLADFHLELNFLLEFNFLLSKVEAFTLNSTCSAEKFNFLDFEIKSNSNFKINPFVLNVPVFNSIFYMEVRVLLSNSIFYTKVKVLTPNSTSCAEIKFLVPSATSCIRVLKFLNVLYDRRGLFRIPLTLETNLSNICHDQTIKTYETSIIENCQVDSKINFRFLHTKSRRRSFHGPLHWSNNLQKSF